MRKLKEHEISILIMIKLDAESLHERVVQREKEYLRIFSTKRTREHFKDVFKTRFWDIHPDDLKICSQEVLIQLNKFYSHIDNLFWYLSSTEDMPGTIVDRVAPKIKEINYEFSVLKLFLEAQLSAKNDEQVPLSNIEIVQNQSSDKEEDQNSQTG